MTTAPVTPASELRQAAAKIRDRLRPLADAGFGEVPWEVTECAVFDGAEPAEPGCPCIVFEPGGPGVSYVADAETSGLAAFIAMMGPPLAEAVADWLEAEAVIADRLTYQFHAMSPGPLRAARIINGTGGGER